MLFAVVACSLPLFLFPLSPTSLGGADASGLYLQTSPATLYLSHSSHLFLAAYSSMSKSTLPFLVLLYSVRVSTVTHRLSKPLQFLTPSLFLLNSAIFLSYSPFFAVALLHSLFCIARPCSTRSPRPFPWPGVATRWEEAAKMVGPQQVELRRGESVRFDPPSCQLAVAALLSQDFSFPRPSTPWRSDEG